MQRLDNTNSVLITNKQPPKSRKTANILFALCFLIFIFAGAAATVLKPKESASFYENRSLASVPALSSKSFVDGSWFAAWETYLKDHAAGRETLLKAGTLIDLYVIGRPVVNDVVIANGMLLGYNAYEQVDSSKISEQSNKMAKNMSALRDIVEECGGIFRYVAVPGQYAYFADRYPGYLNNRQAYLACAVPSFKSAMEERGVNLLDMGDVFRELGMSDSYYSTADYHYTFYGAYETYKSIISELKHTSDYSFPLLEEKDLRFDTLDNPYLGSRERKLFNLASTGEKAVIATPNQLIPFSRTDNGEPNGSWIYSVPNNSWDTVTYSIYMGGDQAETVIQTNRPELPNVLIVGDSFTNPVECLMYLSCNEMRSIDLRHYTEMGLSDYIKAYRPDVVIMLRDYEVMLSFDGNGTVF